MTILVYIVPCILLFNQLINGMQPSRSLLYKTPLSIYPLKKYRSTKICLQKTRIDTIRTAGILRTEPTTIKNEMHQHFELMNGIGITLLDRQLILNPSPAFRTFFINALLTETHNRTLLFYRFIKAHPNTWYNIQNESLEQYMNSMLTLLGKYPINTASQPLHNVLHELSNDPIDHPKLLEECRNLIKKSRQFLDTQSKTLPY